MIDIVDKHDTALGESRTAHRPNLQVQGFLVVGLAYSALHVWLTVNSSDDFVQIGFVGVILISVFYLIARHHGLPVFALLLAITALINAIHIVLPFIQACKSGFVAWPPIFAVSAA